MSRATRVSTIRRHLVEGGLVDLELGEATQKAGHPARHETDGFAARQHVNETGTLLVIVGAYGPDWFTTMREARHRLEQPYVKCHVDAEAPGLADNELLVRWATSEELQARKAAQSSTWDAPEAQQDPCWTRARPLSQDRVEGGRKT
ncbi:hypothetical protein ACWCY6_17910 [Streptomyces sp. 900105755]